MNDDQKSGDEVKLILANDVSHSHFGKIETVEGKIDDALLIPQKSTFEIQENTYVYILKSDSIVEMRSFVHKYRFDDYYIIESGLSSTDAIVYEGIQRVKEGEAVDDVAYEFVISRWEEVGGDSEMISKRFGK